ncbi:hypothetical protein BJX64DRAFT_284161 [Aspergillus heterothallicus]
MAGGTNHHCLGCGKAFKPTCIRKGHVEICSKHPRYRQAGKSCDGCDSDAEREITAARKAKDEERQIQKAQEEEDEWENSGKKNDKKKKKKKKE